ncbi:hypothetical protein M9458_049867, partial [Cirrhinus mrigala]
LNLLWKRGTQDGVASFHSEAFMRSGEAKLKYLNANEPERLPASGNHVWLVSGWDGDALDASWSCNVRFDFKRRRPRLNHAIGSITARARWHRSPDIN